MDLTQIAQRERVVGHGRISLIEMPTFEERKLLCQMMQADEIWQKLALDEPPKPGRLNLAFENGYHEAFFIRFEPQAKIAGFILLHTAKRKREGIVEVDIAVTDPEIRKQKIALEACFALFHHTLDKGYCQTLWAWLDKENMPSANLIRSLGVTVIEQEEKGNTAYGEVETIEVRLTYDEWQALKTKRNLVFEDA
ncbi:MAG: hypothetical protein CMH56_13830 [Myxococcales bacterium]|nr:hypothetical protein [Myxococcales bacterium]|tara:strand:+ start:947 stop:1531 length:585 start_codon:yes stop_codon:yes gene_type:complete